MKTIVDISHHQVGIILKSLTGVDDVIYRASIGSTSVDKSFHEFMKQNSKPFAMYVASYSKNPTEAKEEAKYICSLAEQYGVKPIICFDFEYFSAKYIKDTFKVETTPYLVQSMTEAFCDECIRRGYRAGVYFNLDYLLRFYTKEFFIKHPNYFKWYARPGLATPDYKCDLWQYASNSGAEFGYYKNIDKNLLINDEFATVYVEPMQPINKDPIQLEIGYASAGDLNKIKTQVEGLGIEAKIVADGYIVTGVASAGDQCYLMITFKLQCFI